MSEISDRYRSLAAEMTRRVAAVPADQWDNASPCHGWSARAVLRHIIDNCRTLPGSVGLSPELTGSVEEDPSGAWAEARDALQSLLDDPATAALPYQGYFGHSSLEKTVDQFGGMDLLVHGWDIARATGQDATLPAHEVTRRVEAVSADQWDNASPCHGGSCRVVLRHMIDNAKSFSGHVGRAPELTRSVEDDPSGAWAEAREAL